jgi:hypothetical protein
MSFKKRRKGNEKSRYSETNVAAGVFRVVVFHDGRVRFVPSCEKKSRRPEASALFLYVRGLRTAFDRSVRKPEISISATG